MPPDAPPVLLHVGFSHYAEKARWALDFKRVPHERCKAPPGLHPLWARRFGGGRTIPVLRFADGEVAADSERIVAALERRHPEPPLYPEDAADRERALALERDLGERLGHDLRRLTLDHLRRHPQALTGMLARGGGGSVNLAARLATVPAGTAARAYFGVSAASVERAWRTLDEAIGRFHAELGPDGYLAGQRFSVADLTFAALAGTMAGVRRLPYRALPGPPELRARLAEGGVLEWIEEMYARHRGQWLCPR